MDLSVSAGQMILGLVVALWIFCFILGVHIMYSKKGEKIKKKEPKYFIAKNRAQLMSEVDIGLKIISNLKTLIYLNALTDEYLNNCIKRLEEVVLCYDSHYGIEALGKIHKSRHNKDMLKISLFLLELEFNKV